MRKGSDGKLLSETIYRNNQKYRPDHPRSSKLNRMKPEQIEIALKNALTHCRVLYPFISLSTRLSYLKTTKDAIQNLAIEACVEWTMNK